MKRLRQALACLLLCALLAGTASVPAAALTDVPEDFWAREDVQRCVSLQYFYAEADGSFGVGKDITRAEFTAMLCRFFGWKLGSPPAGLYEDVDVGAWYAGPVEIAYRQGAIADQGGRFRPEDPITRSEAAAMLVRALGYGTIAGLIQNVTLPFQDVHSNNGYIFMAYGFGLMDGASLSAFSPDAHITREQAAVIIMRLHEKLKAGEAGRIGIVSSAEGLPDLTGYEAVGVAAAKLTYNGSPQVVAEMKDAEAKAIQAAASAAGASHLLYVTGSTYQFRVGDSGKLAERLFKAAEAGGYDGIFLDVSGLASISLRDELTAAARLLREKLGDRPLYIVAEAPSWTETSGYDYAALGEIADRLVLRIARKSEQIGDMTVAPLEPLERLYYALSHLRGVVDAGKLTLLLTSSGSEWTGQAFSSVSGGDITALLAERGTQSHYATRYACAYLTRESGDAVWYLNGQSIKERVQMALLFGGGRVCLSDMNAALPEVLEAMP